MTDHFSHNAAAPVLDTLVIGAGPGGLSAAIYLRRFTRKVAVVDKGESRLRLIPVSHNYPGFPEGVPGAQLLANLAEQLENYGGSVQRGEVTRLRLDDGIFIGTVEHSDGSTREIRALTVLLATGVIDIAPPVERWHEAVLSGAVRLCPVCDGYDVIDKRIAVATSDTSPVGHALFMRSFSSDVTLFDRGGKTTLSLDEQQQVKAAGVRYVASPLARVSLSATLQPVLHTDDGDEHPFDVFYPMLGEQARSQLGAHLGVEIAECDKIVADDHGRTSVPGLYAIGDVVRGLNQIAVATGHAAIAATSIHNALPWTLR